jgi:hypothetical protein
MNPLPKRAEFGSGAISGFVMQSTDKKIRIRIKMARILSTAPYSVWRGKSVMHTKNIRFGFSETDSDS